MVGVDRDVPAALDMTQGPPTATSNRDVVQGLWDRFEARDWEGAGELLHDDVVVDWPHTGERFVGRDRVIGMNAAYPEGWAIHVRRIVAEGDRVASEVYVTHPDGNAYAASFFELRDGRIARGVEYWVDERYQDPPDWRAPYREPLER
jgi:ketosteroid isomerase-like protein